MECRGRLAGLLLLLVPALQAGADEAPLTWRLSMRKN